MSEVVLSGPSAYTVYKAIRPAYATITPAVLHKSVRVPTPEEAKALRSNFYYDLRTLHVLLGSASMRRANANVYQSYYTAGSRGVVVAVDSPDPYFLPGETLLVSPAFMLAQFANSWDLATLLKCALWLGGTYSLASNSEFADAPIDDDAFVSSEHAQPLASEHFANPAFDAVAFAPSTNTQPMASDYFDRDEMAQLPARSNENSQARPQDRNILITDCRPLLTRRQLMGLVGVLETHRWRGIGQLRQVAKYFCEGAASPMESELYIKLVLPKKLGGLGLSGLQMNKNVEFGSGSYKIAGQDFARVDFLHPGARVVIEYDSRKFHSEVEQSQRDKRRRDALEREGYKCFSIVPQQIADREVFNACAAPIVKAIKGRCRADSIKFDFAQKELFRKLKYCAEF